MSGSDRDLQDQLNQSRDVLNSLLESLASRPDMQEAIRQMITPEDMLEAFSEIGVRDPDLARLTLQACVAALVNLQSVKAIEAEIQRRAELN